MRIFGLTGGIGSGKSSVAAVFREAGVPVVDADQLARAVVAPGSPALAQLCAMFGEALLQADGQLDRRALAQRVFGDPAARRALEAITHPAVRDAARDAFAALARQGHPLACYEVPLLFETGQADRYRPVVVVAVSPQTQIERASARDDSPAEAVRARIAAQWPLADKVAGADYVIENSGSPASTRARALEVLASIRAALALPSSAHG